MNNISNSSINNALHSFSEKNLTDSDYKKAVLGAKLLHNDGHCNGIEGHISFKLEDNCFAVSPLNKKFLSLNINDMVLVDNYFIKRDSSSLDPHYGAKFHLNIYKAHNSTKCVIHTHP